MIPERNFVISILKKISAYAIMPIGKKEITSPFGQKNESPDRIAVQFGDSSFLL